MRKVWFIMLALGLFNFASCASSENTLDEGTEEVEDAAEDAADEVEDAADEVEDEVDDKK